MKNEEFIEFIEKPEQTAEKSIDELKSFAREHPYSQVAQLLYAIRLRHSSEHLFNQQLGKTSILTNDRSVLYELFEGNNDLVEAKSDEEPTEINEEGYWVKPYRPEKMEPISPETEISREEEPITEAQPQADTEGSEENTTNGNEPGERDDEARQESMHPEVQPTAPDEMPPITPKEELETEAQPPEKEEEAGHDKEQQAEADEQTDPAQGNEEVIKERLAAEKDEWEDEPAEEESEEKATPSSAGEDKDDTISNGEESQQEAEAEPEPTADEALEESDAASEKALPKDERLRAIVLKNRALRKDFKKKREGKEQDTSSKDANADLVAKKEELRQEREEMRADSNYGDPEKLPVDRENKEELPVASDKKERETAEQQFEITGEKQPETTEAEKKEEISDSHELTEHRAEEEEAPADAEKETEQQERSQEKPEEKTSADSGFAEAKEEEKAPSEAETLAGSSIEQAPEPEEDKAAPTTDSEWQEAQAKKEEQASGDHASENAASEKPDEVEQSAAPAPEVEGNEPETSSESSEQDVKEQSEAKAELRKEITAPPEVSKEQSSGEIATDVPQGEKEKAEATEEAPVEERDTDQYRDPEVEEDQNPAKPEQETTEADEISSRIAKIRTQLGKLHQRVQSKPETEADSARNKPDEAATEPGVKEQEETPGEKQEEATLEGAAYLQENAHQPDSSEAQVNEGAEMPDPEKVPATQSKEKPRDDKVQVDQQENTEEEALLAEADKDTNTLDGQYDPEEEASGGWSTHLPKGAQKEAPEADPESTGEGEAMLAEGDKGIEEQIVDAPPEEEKPDQEESVEEEALVAERTGREEEDKYGQMTAEEDEKLWLEEVPLPGESEDKLLDIEALIAENYDRSEEMRAEALQFDPPEEEPTPEEPEEKQAGGDGDAPAYVESEQDTAVDTGEDYSKEEKEKPSGDREYPMYEESDDALEDDSDFDESAVENEDEKDDESNEYGYGESAKDTGSYGEDKNDSDTDPTEEGAYSFSNWLKKITDPNYKPPDIAPEEPKREAGDASGEEDQNSGNEPVNRIGEKMELLDSFVEKLPTLKSKKVLQVHTKPDPEAEQSQEESTDIVTETLARIYVKQGHYKKALKAYQILKLKYPDKGELFVDQIIELKKKLAGK